MYVTLGDLNRLTITKLKVILKKLYKEPQNGEILTTIEIIKNLILDKKRKSAILHPPFQDAGEGKTRAKLKPVHLH